MTRNSYSPNQLRRSDRTALSYWRVWCAVRTLVRQSPPVQLNLLFIGVVFLLLGLTDQGHDILWALANDADRLQWAVAVGGLMLLTMSVFVTTRVLFRVWPWRGGPPPSGSQRRWLIGVTAAPFAGISVACLLTGLLAYQNVAAGRSGVFVCGSIGVLCSLIAAGWAASMDFLLSAKFDGKDRVKLNRFQSFLLTVTQLSTGHPRSDLLTAYVISNLGIVSLMAFAIATWNPEIATTVGPVGTIVTAATVWVFLLNPVALALAKVRLPPLLVLAVLLFIGGLNSDNHTIRELSPPAVRTPVPAAFNEWLKLNASTSGNPERYTPQNPYPVFLVAAAGGGIRNAYWTAGVLGRIEDRAPGFGGHVFVISGVSGGSVGGVVYAGLQNDYSPQARSASTPSFQDLSSKILSQDLLSPLLAKLMLPDAVQRFVPIPVETLDRARALEDALSQAYADVSKFPRRMDIGFYALDPLRNPGVPFLVLNTTRVETGARYPVSHLELRTPASIPLGNDIPLKVAAFMSARFPVVTPAARLPESVGGGRVVDGGYFENSGIETLVNVLDQIMDYPGDYEVPFRIHVVTTQYIEPPPSTDPGILGDLLSPLQASLATRRARGVLAAANLEEWVARYSARTSVGRSVSAATIPIDLTPNNAGVRVPLGWRLSSGAKAEMDEQLDRLLQPAHIALIIRGSQAE